MSALDIKVSDKSCKGFVVKHLILKISSEPIMNLFCTSRDKWSLSRDRGTLKQNRYFLAPGLEIGTPCLDTSKQRSKNKKP
ncbi:hypothetical protein EPI10_017152 [Gossypium australe]|uniref:Uncharacterized protein n=1 Tax=Gossypium australe TaxID=47621 RepID=A0A5B6VRC1_9ROSI|nr:hypothetical protein EPI10_017152 [Gossypium australe]